MNMNSKIEIKEQNGKIWSHVKQEWRIETPEERVRQHFLTVLVNEYGYLPEQMKEEESVTGRGSGQARADFIIWRIHRSQVREALVIVNASVKHSCTS